MSKKFIKIGNRIINPDMVVSATWDDESVEPLSVALVDAKSLKFEGEEAKKLWAELENDSKTLDDPGSADWIKSL